MGTVVFFLCAAGWSGGVLMVAVVVCAKNPCGAFQGRVLSRPLLRLLTVKTAERVILTRAALEIAFVCLGGCVASMLFGYPVRHHEAATAALCYSPMLLPWIDDWFTDRPRRRRSRKRNRVRWKMLLPAPEPRPA